MKGNMFLGYARGSVGDVTFARQNGQQVGRARNRKPNNPRTASQMTQRSVFISAVKFFSKGVQNLFTFAFEDKRPQESDYNAFMRRNAKAGMYMTKNDYENPTYPALGNWQLSYGSLSAFTGEADTSADRFNGITEVADSSSTAITTVADLTKILTATNLYQVGDIITLVEIYADFEVGDESLPIASTGNAPVWHISQFILKADDKTTLASLGIVAERKTTSNLVYLQSTTGLSDTGGYAFIHSRKKDGKILVSSQSILNGNSVAQAIEYGTSDVWLQQVLTSWSAAEAAILEGSRASNG